MIEEIAVQEKVTSSVGRLLVTLKSKLYSWRENSYSLDESLYGYQLLSSGGLPLHDSIPLSWLPRETHLNLRLRRFLRKPAEQIFAIDNDYLPCIAECDTAAAKVLSEATFPAVAECLQPHYQESDFLADDMTWFPHTDERDDDVTSTASIEAAMDKFKAIMRANAMDIERISTAIALLKEHQSLWAAPLDSHNADKLTTSCLLALRNKVSSCEADLPDYASESLHVSLRRSCEDIDVVVELLEEVQTFLASKGISDSNSTSKGVQPDDIDTAQALLDMDTPALQRAVSGPLRAALPPLRLLRQLIRESESSSRQPLEQAEEQEHDEHNEVFLAALASVIGGMWTSLRTAERHFLSDKIEEMVVSLLSDDEVTLFARWSGYCVVSHSSEERKGDSDGMEMRRKVHHHKLASENLTSDNLTSNNLSPDKLTSINAIILVIKDASASEVQKMRTLDGDILALRSHWDDNAEGLAASSAFPDQGGSEEEEEEIRRVLSALLRDKAEAPDRWAWRVSAWSRALLDCVTRCPDDSVSGDGDTNNRRDGYRYGCGDDSVFFGDIDGNSDSDSDNIVHESVTDLLTVILEAAMWTKGRTNDSFSHTREATVRNERLRALSSLVKLLASIIVSLQLCVSVSTSVESGAQPGSWPGCLSESSAAWLTQMGLETIARALTSSSCRDTSDEYFQLLDVACVLFSNFLEIVGSKLVSEGGRAMQAIFSGPACDIISTQAAVRQGKARESMREKKSSFVVGGSGRGSVVAAAASTPLQILASSLKKCVSVYSLTQRLREASSSVEYRKALKMLRAAMNKCAQASHWIVPRSTVETKLSHR